MTPLDEAHAAMEAAPQDDAARLRFYERLADGELLLVLEAPAQEDKVRPVLLSLDEGAFALVFDREDRLAAFSEKPADYVAASGRQVVAMLTGQNIGLGVNLGVAPSSTLLPPGCA